MKIKDLKPNPKNPRKISDEKLALLKKTLLEFGDLGGFVFNRETKQLIGGHQRAKIFNNDTEIVIEKMYKKATKTGTVAEGYVILNGEERFKYREVAWDETREKAANIAANKGAGEWDLNLLSEWMIDLDSMGMDLDLTLFDEAERSDLLVPSLNPNFEPGSESDQGALDKKNPVECPKCGETFVP